MTEKTEQLREKIERLLDDHTISIFELRKIINQLEVANEVVPEIAKEVLEKVLSNGRELRGILHEAVEMIDGPEILEASDLAGLKEIVHGILKSLDELVLSVPHERVKRLLQELRSGSCGGGFRRASLTGLQLEVISEVEMNLSKKPEAVAIFPGPDEVGASWLIWFWEMESASQDQTVKLLQPHWPNLVSFLDRIHKEYWNPGLIEKNLEQITTPLEIDQEIKAEATSSLVEELVPNSVKVSMEDAAPFVETAENKSEDQKLSVPTVVPTEMENAYAPKADESIEPKAEPVQEPASEYRKDLPTVSRVVERVSLPKVVNVEDFLVKFWLDERGAVEEAPWTKSGFDAQIVENQFQAILRCDWASAYLYSIAGDKLKIQQIAPKWILDWIRAFGSGSVFQPEEASAEAGLSTAKGLDFQKSPSPKEFLFFIYNVFNKESFVYPDSSVTDICMNLKLSSPLTVFLEEWYSYKGMTDVSTTLRKQVGGTTVSVNELKKTEVKHREDLKNEFKSMFVSAPVKLDTTHCRKAWIKYLKEVTETMNLFIEGKVMDDGWRKIKLLKIKADEIFDNENAKFNDRAKMDNNVDLLLDLAELILKTQELIRNTEEYNQEAKKGIKFKKSFVDSLNISDHQDFSTEHWIYRFVVAHIGQEPTFSGNYFLKNEQFMLRPLLLEGWSQLAYPISEIDVRKVNDPVWAAARMISPALETPIEDVELWLANHRPDILSGAQKLHRQDVLKLVEKYTLELQNSLHSLSGQLRIIENKLAEMADDAFMIANQARLVIEQSLEQPLVRLKYAWVKYCAEILQRRVDLLTQNILHEAIAGGLDKEYVESLINAGQVGTVLRNLGQINEVGAIRTRATLFRKEAEERWKNPSVELSSIQKKGELDESVKIFLKSWLAARNVIREQVKYEELIPNLLEEFSDLIFQKSRRNKNTIRLYNPKKGTHYVQVKIEDMRAWLEADVGNPTFLPQLTRYKSIVIKCAAGHYVTNLPNRIVQEAKEHEMTVILTPALTPDQRRSIKESLNQKTLPGPVAIVDDLDLCRILNLGGEPPDPLLAITEVFLEQQPLNQVGPYEAVEGQHIHLEMFVGRANETKSLVEQANYSRIFSGRRLGKTALLRSIEGKGGRTLPSGNSLQIVFCSIAGMDTEPQVASTILTDLEKKLGIADSSGDLKAGPVEKLKNLIEQFLHQQPTSSLLVLLDEADTFFETQIDSEMSIKQQSLSWWMSRHAEKELDKNQLPRVRFVFCGYLHVDQNRGVWENKGEVLLLRPLDIQDAVQLATAPLARIGIDTSEQADNIAFRCGYQPAVMIRFGVTLLEHLQKNKPLQSRERIKVELKDILDVFYSNRVQDSIQEACWLNFVGNPLGKMIFAALLMELRDSPPAAVLEDVADKIRRHIESIDPSFNPQVICKASWNDLVSQKLRELVDRSMLVQVRTEPVSYRLRFPHHLSVLIRQEPETYLRDAIDQLQTVKKRRDWIISEPIIDAVQYSLGQDGKDAGIKAVVVCSHWRDPLVDAETGLGPRVGLTESERSRVFCNDLAIQQISDLSKVLEPLLLVGGPELGRRAIALEELTGGVEVARTCRLSFEQILLWFQRKRAVEFTAHEASKKIMRSTRGIPILVQALDGIISKNYPAGTIDEKQLEKILAEMSKKNKDIARRLTDGPEALSQRERELVKIIARACKIWNDEFSDAIQNDMVDLSDLDKKPGSLTPDDSTSIKLLLALGILPRSPVKHMNRLTSLEEVAPFEPDDPIVEILELLHR